MGPPWQKFKNHWAREIGKRNSNYCDCVALEREIMQSELRFGRTVMPNCNSAYPSFSNTCNTRRMQSFHKASLAWPYLIKRMRDQGNQYPEPQTQGSSPRERWHSGAGIKRLLCRLPGTKTPICTPTDLVTATKIKRTTRLVCRVQFSAHPKDRHYQSCPTPEPKETTQNVSLYLQHSACTEKSGLCTCHKAVRTQIGFVPSRKGG